MTACVGKTIKAKVTEIEWCTVEEGYGRISITIIRVGQDESPEVELRLPYTRFPVSYLGPQDHEGDLEINLEQVALQECIAVVMESVLRVGISRKRAVDRSFRLDIHPM